MPRGRPKGSKNKSRNVAVTEQPKENSPAKELQVNPANIRVLIPSCNSDPEMVVTQTMFGTPIAIVDIMKSKSGHMLMVIPRYNENDKKCKTIVDSRSVLAPKYATAEIEKEFYGVEFFKQKEENESQNVCN